MLRCMRRIASIIVTFLQLAHSWWCDTSALTGCRGQPRQFVHKPTDEGAFNSFNKSLSQIRISSTDDPIVLDWDKDGHLDVVIRTDQSLVLFTWRRGVYAKVEPNPLDSIAVSLCRPAVVDWDGDGRLEVIVGSPTGIKYYKQISMLRPVRFIERTGAENPFNHIEGGSYCGDLSVADWDGDGDLDMLVVYPLSKMNFFEQVNGSLVYVEESKSPFQPIMSQTLHRRPLMVDWNGDGHTDLILMSKVFPRKYRESWFDILGCTVSLYLQSETGLTLDWHINMHCQNFNGSGASFVDVDGDGDLDAIFGGYDGPMKLFQHHVSDGVHFLAKPKSQTSNIMYLDQVQLNSILPDFSEAVANFFKPALADWDLDGDLDLALIQYEGSRYFEQENGRVIEIDMPPSNGSCPIHWDFHFGTTDLDGDGDLDLYGFDEKGNTILCLQRELQYVFVQEESRLFHAGLEDAFLKATALGFPCFLDWDGDNDIDILKIHGRELYFLEHLSNGTFHAQLLPVPLVRDFIAADFDGDGDIDLVLSFANAGGCHFFERKGDGSLEELSGIDNPFETACASTSTASSSDSLTALATLADWDNDGDLDFILVYDKIMLWTNEDMQSFVAYEGGNFRFPDVVFTSPAVVNFVDADGDGDLDLVVPPQTVRTELGQSNYRYFEHLNSGDLVERHGAENPFHKAPEGDANFFFNYLGSHMIVDVDGDGKVDIVRGNLRYARQQEDGQFTFVEGPTNPFRDLALYQKNGSYDCWTLVDWDHDGDMDLVVVEVPPLAFSETLLGYFYAGRISREAFLAVAASQIRFYEQVNSTFVEHAGAANPFHSANVPNLTTSLTGPWCPSFVDLDDDGNDELVLESASKILIYEQRDGEFQRSAANPFAGLSIDKRNVNSRTSMPHPSLFADWDGDGLLDFINVHGTRLQYFQRGVCSPAASHCKLGLCNEKTSQCECIPGAVGEDCTLCDAHHVRDGSTCRRCPGYKTVAGTCSRRGVCDDDSDARGRQAALNESGFKVQAAMGTGECHCLAPFFGKGCVEGLCPPGQWLNRDADVEFASEKYPKWEACAPCEPGSFKDHSGNEECSLCPTGFVPAPHARSCVACSSGRFPHPNRINCSLCETGYVALSGSGTCTPCKAGTAPSQDRSECIPCAAGRVAGPRSSECKPCDVGFVPDANSRGTCKKCSGQTYAFDDDEVCRSCSFPSMILPAADNLCSPLYTIVFFFSGVALCWVGAGVYGWVRLTCLRQHLQGLTRTRNWQQVYAIEPSYLKYSICKRKADRKLEACKRDIKLRSLQLGISLEFVFNRLRRVYEETAQQAEWRSDGAPLTRSGFLVKVRNLQLPIRDPEASWNTLPICTHPGNPNFHQLAGVMAYGPWALGKGQCCPRDGKPDCSIVDALEARGKSAHATHFLSWVWGYQLDDVCRALQRWWITEQIVSGNQVGSIYIWWCVFVNNQFRMLENGEIVEADDLFDVFGKQLQGIGKMLMCFDRLNSCVYTERIWCIFEVFVACQKGIPTTLILPEVQVGAINSVADLTRECRVRAEDARASVPEDAQKIKEHIQNQHGGFNYVNQTVEINLWSEVIKHLEAPPRAAVALPLQQSSSSESSEFRDDLRSTPHLGRCNLQ